jgi:hypothetical protein
MSSGPNASLDPMPFDGAFSGSQVKKGYEMKSLSENPAVHAPHQILTRPQQHAINIIAFYRRQRRVGNQWLVGDKKISDKLVSDLKRMELVREQLLGGGSILSLTQAGRLVADRLSVQH